MLIAIPDGRIVVHSAETHKMGKRDKKEEKQREKEEKEREKQREKEEKIREKEEKEREKHREKEEKEREKKDKRMSTIKSTSGRKSSIDSEDTTITASMLPLSSPLLSSPLLSSLFFLSLSLFFLFFLFFFSSSVADLVSPNSIGPVLRLSEGVLQGLFE